MRLTKAERSADRVWIAQATYYLISGVWPLIDIHSFQMLTGPKTDRWLVKTVGVLVTVVGAVVGLAGCRRRVTPEIVVLATASCAGLTAIDVIYVLRRRISGVYLLDALAQIVILGGWALRSKRTAR